MQKIIAQRIEEQNQAQASMKEIIAQREAERKADLERSADIERYTATENFKALPPGKAQDIVNHAVVLRDTPIQDIANDLDSARAKVLAANIDWKAVAKERPVTKRWLKRPETASLIASDAVAMDTMEALLSGRWRVRPTTPEERERGEGLWRSEMIGKPVWAEKLSDVWNYVMPQATLAWQDFLNTVGVPGFEDKAGRERVRTALQKQLQKDYVGERRATGWNYLFSAEMAIDAISGGVDAFPMLAVAAAGATLGGAGGTVAIPIPGVGTISGAVFGAGTAMSLYLFPTKFAEHKKAYGDTETGDLWALATATTGAVAESALFTKGFAPHIGLTDKGMRWLFPSIVESSLERLTVPRILGYGLRNFSYEMISGAATMTVAGMVDRSIQEIGKMGLDGLGIPGAEKPDGRKVIANVMEDFERNLRGMPLLAAHGAGVRFLHDMHRMGIGYQNKRLIDAVLDANLASKIRRENPKLWEQLVREMGVQPGSVTHLYLDIQALEQFAQAKGLDLNKVMDIVLGDKGEGWRQAKTEGAVDIAIPIDRAHRLLDAREFVEFIRAEGRFSADAAAPRIIMEAAVLLKKQMEKPPEPQTEGEKSIYEDTRERLLDLLKSLKSTDTDVSWEELADNAAKIVLAWTKHIHSRLPGANLFDVYAATFGEIGYWGSRWRGEYFDRQGNVVTAITKPEQHTGSGHPEELIGARHDILRKIWLDKDGKYRPVSLKDVRMKLDQPGAQIEEQRVSNLAGYDSIFAKGITTLPGWYHSALKEIVLGNDLSSRFTAKTVLHELGHSYAYMLKELAKKHGGDFAVEYEALTRAMGYSGAADRAARHVPKYEERMSLWMERYFAEGKAPTPELVPVFKRYSLWLKQLIDSWYPPSDTRSAEAKTEENWERYTKSSKGSMGPVPRKMFDRFFGAEEKLAEFQAELSQIDKRVAEYLKKTGKIDADGKLTTDTIFSPQDTALSKLMEAINKAERRFIKDEFDKVRAKILEDLKGTQTGDPTQNMYQVIAWLSRDEAWGQSIPDIKEILTDPETGKALKLDFQGLKAAVGTEAAMKLAKRRMTTQDPMRAIAIEDFMGVMTNAGLIEKGKDIAKYFEELAGAKRIDEYLDDVAAQEVRGKYGNDLLDNPSEFHRAALDAAMNVKEVAKRLTLFRALAQDISPDHMKRAAVTPEYWESLAARLINDKTLRQISAERFYNSMIAADKRALKALEEGNRNAAFDAVQQAILNHYMYKAAREVEGKMENAWEKIADKATRDSWRAALGKANPAYRDLHDAILYALGLMGDNFIPAESGADAILTFLDQAKLDGMETRVVGWDVDKVRGLLDGSKRWKDFKPDEAKEIYNAILNIKKIAEEINAIKVADKRAEITGLLDEFEAYADKAGLERKPTAQDKSLEPALDRVVRGLQGIRAGLMEPRTWLKRMGSGMFQAVWGEFRVARKYKDELLNGIFKDYEERFKAYEGKDERFGPAPGLAEMLPMENMQGPVSKQWLINVMLWMGNESSRMKALKGTGWNIDKVLEAAGKYLTKADLEWIQGMHDLSDQRLLPLIRDKYEKRYGLPMEEVKPMPYTVKLADGTEHTVMGGYYPVRYDATVSKLKQVQGAEALEVGGISDLFPATSKAYMKARTGYVDVPDFNWSGYPSHLARVIHDLAFGDYVHDMGKLFLNQRANTLLRERLGDAVAEQPKEWLLAVARESAGSIPDALRPIHSLLGYSRGMLIFSAIGHNIGVAMGDLTHVFAAGTLRGEGAFYNVTRTVPAMIQVTASATASLFTGRNETRDWALANSLALQHRASTVESDYRKWWGEEVVKAPGSKTSNMINRVRDTSFWFIKEVDALVSTTLWVAKYREEMAKGVGEKIAIEKADDMVESAMPSHSFLEMPAIMRDKRGVGSMIVFYSYWNKLLNMADQQHWEMVKTGEGNKAWNTARWAGRTLAMLSFGAVMGDFFMGHGKDPDEDWGTWYTRKILGSPFMLLPVVGNFTQPLIDKTVSGRIRSFNEVRAPGYAMFYTLSDMAQRISSGKMKNEDKFFAMMDASLSLARLPGRSWTRGAHYMYDLASDTAKPRGPFDVGSGIIYGHKDRGQSETPLTAIDTLLSGGHP